MATPDELDAVRGRLLGLIDESRIRAVRITRPAPDVVDRFLRITDLTSTVSDAMDALGVGSAIPAHVLAPLAGRPACVRACRDHQIRGPWWHTGCALRP